MPKHRLVKAPTVSPSLILVSAILFVGFLEHSFGVIGQRLAVPLAADGYGRSSLQISSWQYPRSATDADGYNTKLSQPPKRIASQFWSLDEYLYSVVPSERIVAVSEHAYKLRFSNVYDQVTRYRPVIASDPERVLRQNPDLLMVANTSRTDFCDLVRSTGIPIYRAFVTFTSLEEVAETIRLTGYLTGEDGAAAAAIDRFWEEIAKAKSRKNDHTKPRVLGLGGRHGYGDKTLFNDIVKTLGGTNVAAEGGMAGYKAVNSEQIVRWDPEWIFVGADPAKRAQVLTNLLSDPAIATTTAARRSQIVVLDNRLLLPLSPFSTRLVMAISEALYG